MSTVKYLNSKAMGTVELVKPESEHYQLIFKKFDSDSGTELTSDIVTVRMQDIDRDIEWAYAEITAAQKRLDSFLLLKQDINNLEKK